MGFPYHKVNRTKWLNDKWNNLMLFYRNHSLSVCLLLWSQPNAILNRHFALYDFCQHKNYEIIYSKLHLQWVNRKNHLNLLRCAFFFYFLFWALIINASVSTILIRRHFYFGPTNCGFFLVLLLIKGLVFYFISKTQIFNAHCNFLAFIINFLASAS